MIKPYKILILSLFILTTIVLGLSSYLLGKAKDVKSQANAQSFVIISAFALFFMVVYYVYNSEPEISLEHFKRLLGKT